MNNDASTVESLIRQYLPTKEIMQLATVRDGQPWICTVHFFNDEDLNIYWMSSDKQRHSQEVIANPHTAIAVAVKTDEPVMGIQAEGDAGMVTDEDEANRILPLYFAKHPSKNVRTFAELEEKGMHLYRLKPRLFVMFDLVNSPTNPRREWRPE